MTTQAVYNKWRGQSFDDILGQEHITRTLRNQIRAGRIGHAYLFTGVRGTGKTSTARILAKAINCIGGTDDPPCNRCSICTSITSGAALDLIEVDAASNRGIDEIRDLRDKVNFAPSECRYKVYVIDEVHMLTREAFNALLKTLEEPPSHVVFVLCTTEPHKLPDTVLSRCQRFDFRRGTVEVIGQNLARICAAEGISIAPDALDFVARRAAGSYRDAVSLLDQLAAYGNIEITLEHVQHILGTVPDALVTDLVRGMLSGEIAAGLRAIDRALDQGAEPASFLSAILDQLRALMLVRVGTVDGLTRFAPETLEDLRALATQPNCSLNQIVRAIRLFTEASRSVRNAMRPQLLLEIALVEASLVPAEAAEAAQPAEQPPAPSAAPSATPRSAASRARRMPDGPPAPAEAPAQEDAPAAFAETPAAPDPGYTASAEPPSPAPTDTTLSLDWVRAKWRQVYTRMRNQDPAVAALVNSSSPLEVRDNTLRLGCVGAYVRDKLADPKRRAAVEAVAQDVLGAPLA
ncbi:MAG: DNA polymerase III subunit gamma/tau, partial [Chloroflexi bacterium]|nr:DNA polymerase III subunit gamma/tau [Chloroflexota bacterium]